MISTEPLTLPSMGGPGGETIVNENPTASAAGRENNSH